LAAVLSDGEWFDCADATTSRISRQKLWRALKVNFAAVSAKPRLFASGLFAPPMTGGLRPC